MRVFGAWFEDQRALSRGRAASRAADSDGNRQCNRVMEETERHRITKKILSELVPDESRDPWSVTPESDVVAVMK